MAGTTRIPYHFNLTCGHEAMVEVDAETMTPINPETGRPDITSYRTNFGQRVTTVVYTCPECGTTEAP